MKYGYVRVSTEAQNIARQMEEMYKLGLTDEFIYVDKQSCKDFERENYKLLKEILKKDDLLTIKSIDRLGRNYDMIINEWSEITKVIEADIFIIDFPLLDTREDGMNLVGNFISYIVLEVLSFVAQNERENIRKRQEARQLADSDLDALYRELISIVSKGLDEKYDDIIDQIQQIDGMNQESKRAGERQIAAVRSLRKRITDIGNSLNMVQG